MRIKLIPFAVLAANVILVSSCASDDVTGINPDPAGNSIHFTPSVGHSTRAVETTIKNLGDFAVVAKGVHPHGGLYTSYLIGTNDGGETAAKKGLAADNESGTWVLERDVYWPAGIEDALFWAYTTKKDGTSKSSPILSSGTFGFNVLNPEIKGFMPGKSDLSSAGKNDIWADGDCQSDLLIAFSQQKRSNDASNVNLKFQHALSQIFIKAIQKDKHDSDHRIVKIKGAWLVNTNNKATLSAGFSWSAEDKKATQSLSWQDLSIVDSESKLSAFGSFYSTPITLGKDAESDVLTSSLMIIPQTVNRWNKTENDKGAYILLLCRVELEHDGTSHEDDANIDDIGISGNKHYHQQFPVNADNKFDASQYGFVCVPLENTWTNGKRYTYTLDICGAASGAGIYPPDLRLYENQLIPTSVDLKIVYDRPSGKNVGDAVLDEPIKFTVTVGNWEDQEETWKPGPTPEEGGKF